MSNQSVKQSGFDKHSSQALLCVFNYG